MTHKRPTATLLARVKREAKALARGTGVPHSIGLEEAARAAGYPSWFALQQAVRTADAAQPLAVAPLPIDPVLPDAFFSTPNEERSPVELDAWWDRPFVQTQADGQLVVRCLDGGAWDRPTYYGCAPSVTEAQVLAAEKLRAWQARRAAPVLSILPGGRFAVLRMAQRPDGEDVVLVECLSPEDAREAIERLAR